MSEVLILINRLNLYSSNDFHTDPYSVERLAY